MTISAKVIADSISLQGKRIVTMQLRYPKFIHGEFMTHRVFSRNASSSRAIPVKRLIEDLRRDPAMPVYWGSNKPGMQAGAEIQGADKERALRDWLEGMEHAIQTASNLMDHGLHKQIANRILEPWCHINVVVTATEWDNFFELRCHPDAQPEMRALAEAMRDAMNASTPRLLKPFEWHLPYADRDEDWTQAKKWADTGEEPPTEQHIKDILISASVARCARVSYLTFEGKEPDIASDVLLWEKLVGARPIHASPAEHQATPDEMTDVRELQAARWEWKHAPQHGNFVGWKQYRKQLEAQLLTS